MKIFNIKFRKTKKVYPFLGKKDEEYTRGDYVLVETIRGDQIGVILNEITDATKKMPFYENVKIRSVKKKLSEIEIKSLDILDKKAQDAYFVCKKVVKSTLPEMNLVTSEYSLDGLKLIFYFTADLKLDFRNLVKEVNKIFRKRVEFYQIKQNDEGRILSAFGRYGKEIYW